MSILQNKISTWFCKPGPERQPRLAVELSLKTVELKNPEAYASAITGVLKDEDKLGSLDIDETFYLEYGEISSSHILYHGVGDLYLLANPDEEGWKAKRVHIANSEDMRETLEGKAGMTLLFKYPNPHRDANSSPDSGESWLEWSEHSYVYEKK